MERLDVTCEERSGGWTCRVSTDATEHVVTVSYAELASLAPTLREPTEMVAASFRFLLEHEPATSILRRFAISEIERYFPAYPAEIERRLQR